MVVAMTVLEVFVFAAFGVLIVVVFVMAAAMVVGQRQHISILSYMVVNFFSTVVD